MGLNYIASKVKWTPAEDNSLVNDEYGLWPSGKLNYIIVVGTMMYLVEKKPTDITYEVNFCAHYMFCSWYYQWLALKRIGIYLKVTSNKYFIINPSKELCRIDCYTDAEFLGMYGYDNPTDISFVKIITYYWITFSNILVLW